MCRVQRAKCGKLTFGFFGELLSHSAVQSKVTVPLNNARKKDARSNPLWVELRGFSGKDNGSDRVAIVQGEPASQWMPIINSAKRLFRVHDILDTAVVECAGSYFLR
jgi:hypothetical protein